MTAIDRELTAYRKAVRQHCLDCSGGALKSADRCTVKQCALYDLRPRMPQKETTNGKQKTQIRRKASARADNG